MEKESLSIKTVNELKKIASEYGIQGVSKKKKDELVKLITDKIGSSGTTKKESAPVQQKSQPQKNSLSKPSGTQAPPDPPKHTAQKHADKHKQNGSNTADNGTSVQVKRAQTTQPQNKQNKQSNHNQPTKNNQEQSQSNGPDSRFQKDSTVEVSGILEVMSDGTHGVLRSPRLIPTDKDTYISISQVKKFKLRKGDFITGIARLPKENERYFSLLWIKSVNEMTVDAIQNRPHFDELKPVYPDKQLKLEVDQYPISNRIIDLLAPIGYGQRGMIVAQPKSGKTFLIKDIAKGINDNYPEIQLMVVLIGERPEEVTDIERSVNGIVYASNFDDSPNHQVMVAELSLERAKRMVEMGKDVVILMDSLTRLARAYNVALPASGRTLSGGLDPVSLYPSKRFFGAARNFEKGASLTIIATSLVDTGSKMDEVIFEEFKGTGNMELKLDRKLAYRRIFPAIDVVESGTRNEEVLLRPEEMQQSWQIRRMLEGLGKEANAAIIDRMKATRSNQEFTNSLHDY
ncbi:MAG: transcription termination factor Rho [Candidatus Dojkabacteria bacterium]